MHPAMAPAGPPPLLQTVDTTLRLIDSFTKTLTSSPAAAQIPGSAAPETTCSNGDTKPDTLALLSDTARLLHAHTTKLSLLTINPPFTPSAVSREMSTAQTSILPSMLAAVTNFTDPAILGQTMISDMRSRARVTMMEFRGLVEIVQSKAREDQQRQRQRQKMHAEKEKERIMSLTGVIWKSCDACVELNALGVSGLLVRKVEEYKGLIEDALVELKEFRDDEEDEGFDEGADSDFSGADNDDNDDDRVQDVQEQIDKLILGASRSQGPSREQIKPLLETTVKILALTKTLYTATCKHRFKTLAKERQTKENLARADDAMALLKQILGEVDELAGALYDGDADGAAERLERVRGMMLGVISRLKGGWGGEDEFGPWWKRFEEAVESAGVRD